jgi:hypothetical protein
MTAHLRVVLRQPSIALEGKKYIVTNDGLEIVDDGVVIADLSSFVRRIEVIDEITGLRLIRLEMFAGEVVHETMPPDVGRWPQLRRENR